MTLPNFIIAGATRSGTSSLHVYLRKHPDVYMPEKKELNYFNNNEEYNKGIDYYRKHFEQYNGETAVGEATPMYMEKGIVYHSSGQYGFQEGNDAIERIAHDLHNCRIIISVRNPVDRIFSMYWKNFYQGKLRYTLHHYLKMEIHGKTTCLSSPFCFLYRNKYDIHLSNIYNYIKKENVLILFFEEWINNTNETMKTICKFLNVSYINKFNFFEKINKINIYKNNDKYFNFIILKIFNRLNHRKTRNIILENLEDSIVHAEALLGRSFDLWRVKR